MAAKKSAETPPPRGGGRGEILKVQCVLRVFVRACTVGSHSSGTLPLYNLDSDSASSVRVRFVATVICGTIAAPDSSDP